MTDDAKVGVGSWFNGKMVVENSCCKMMRQHPFYFAKDHFLETSAMFENLGGCSTINVSSRYSLALRHQESMQSSYFMVTSHPFLWLQSHN